jgi:DNA-directed RNA polymerase specialized sigma subunit
MAGMSFAEKAKLYAALGELENQYGVGAIRAAVAEMIGEDKEIVTVINEPIGLKFEAELKQDGEQMKLLPIADRGRTYTGRVFKGRSAAGSNEKRIKEWLDNRHPEKTGPEVLLEMYYKDGMTQEDIAKMIGVKQPAISKMMQMIPESFKRQIIAGWGK